MEEEASESCFCSETLDIILGMVSGVLEQIHSRVKKRNAWSSHWKKTPKLLPFPRVKYLQHCRSFMSLNSPVSGSSLFSSLLISLLISRCCRNRSSSLAVRSSQDLDRESGWPAATPTWFSMPSEQDIRFMLRLRPP